MITPGAAVAPHPWLEIFAADPVAQLARLLAGRAEIYPYSRAEASDAARMLFGALDPADPLRATLSGAVVQWLEKARRRPLSSAPASLQNEIRQVVEAFEIVSSLGLADAAEQLRRQYIRWRPWADAMFVSSARDAGAAFLRMLANTQGAVSTRFADPDGLSPLWMRTCREAGETASARQLQIGLLGLRRLPLAISRGDTPWIAGVAEWAFVREPSPAEFLAVWRPLKRLYPSAPPVLRKHIYSLLAQKPFKDAGIEPPGWWRSDPDFPASQHRSSLSFQPVPKELREGLIEAIEEGRPLGAMRPRIEQLMDAHRTYAERSGDSDYLIRTFCKVGRTLIEHADESPVERARTSELLAREALNHRPFDIYSWSLWRDSLAARGAYEAARDLGWEIIRRFPNATPARSLLAELMIAGGELTEARRVVQSIISEDRADAVTYDILTRIEAALGNFDLARDAASQGLNHDPTDPGLLSALSLVKQGKKPKLASSHFRIHPVRTDVEGDPVLDAVRRDGRLRALRDRLSEDAALAELHLILNEDPTFAYAQILAARHRIWRVEEKILPPVAAAFEAALAEEDRATLELLAGRAPRLNALIQLARALLGDEDSANFIIALLRQEEERTLLPGETIIKARLAPVLRLVEHGSVPVEAIKENRARVLQVMYDTNEALAAPDLIAA